MKEDNRYNLTVKFNRSENEKMIFIGKVFNTNKNRIIRTLMNSALTLNSLYDYATEYKEKFGVDDGVDLTWMLERKIILI